MSETNQCQWRHLTRKPGSHYRQLFVHGRISARTLYGLYLPGEDWPGMTVEEVAADYGLPLEAAREAIAYCESDPQEIRDDILMEEALMTATGLTEPTYRLQPSPRPLSSEDYRRIYGP